MTRAQKAFALSCAALVVLLLSWLAADWADRREIRANPTSLSRSMAGLSLFFDMKNAVYRDSARLHRKPFLFERDFDGFDSIFILSPLSPISDREGELIMKQVKLGKKLILSFHDEKTHAYLLPLIRHLGMVTTTSEDPDFKNGHAFEIESEMNSSISREGERYHVYSSSRMVAGNAVAGCQLTPLLCYFSETKVGDGTVLLFAGLPPFGNGLISRGDNRLLAFRLAEWSGRALVDEYHHFFTEKTMTDLWMDPRFLLPILGFVILALLYFTFAHTEFRENLRRPPPVPPRRSFHQLNREILVGLFPDEGAVASALQRQADFLRRIFPAEAAKIEIAARPTTGGPKETLRIATRLLLLHQNILKRKGRKAP